MIHTIRKLSIVLFLVALAIVGQSGAPTQQAFDAAYWASQPPAIQALQTAPGRLAAAAQLAESGVAIDFDIQALGEDPYDTMLLRAQYGYTVGVPSMLLQPIGAIPGYAAPGITPQPGQLFYPTVAPAGWIANIPVTTLPAPYSAPAPPAGPVYTLGAQIQTGVYALSSSTGVYPALGTQLTVGKITGVVQPLGPFGLYVLEVNQ
jgi:hypothetical protein